MICIMSQGISKLNVSMDLPLLSLTTTLIDHTIRPIVIVTSTSVRVPEPPNVQLLSATRALSSLNHLQDARRYHIPWPEETEPHTLAAVNFKRAVLP